VDVCRPLDFPNRLNFRLELQKCTFAAGSFFSQTKRKEDERQKQTLTKNGIAKSFQPFNSQHFCLVCQLSPKLRNFSLSARLHLLAPAPTIADFDGESKAAIFVFCLIQFVISALGKIKFTIRCAACANSRLYLSFCALISTINWMNSGARLMRFK